MPPETPRFWPPGQALFTRAGWHLSLLDGKIPTWEETEMDSSEARETLITFSRVQGPFEVV